MQYIWEMMQGVEPNLPIGFELQVASLTPPESIG